MSGDDSELETLREVEEIMRGFVGDFEEQIHAAVTRGSLYPPFAPLTVNMVESLKLLFPRLDELRGCNPTGAAAEKKKPLTARQRAVAQRSIHRSLDEAQCAIVRAKVAVVVLDLRDHAKALGEVAAVV